MEIDGDISMGRASDNAICIKEATVSQYHAVIEKHGDDFWLIDLNSHNGTTVNGISISSEYKLQNSDLISVGMTSITFRSVEDASHQNKNKLSIESVPETELPLEAEDNAAYEATESAVSTSQSRTILITTVAAGLVLLSAIALVVTKSISGSSGTAYIVSPQTGSTISGPEIIRIEVENEDEVDEIIFMLDGVEFAVAEHPPFDAQLDPAQLQSRFRNLSNGNHVLTVTVLDKEGNRTPQPDTILLAFNGSTETKGKEETASGETGTGEQVRLPQRGNADMAALARNLATAVSGKSWHNFDGEFTDQIRRRTGDYCFNSVEDASRYRRQVGNAFSSKGLPPALGFVMAISESRFKENTASQSIGFWRVPRDIALEQGYIAPDETSSSLNDPKRSAEIAASYLNDLVNAFGGLDGFMYAIACYGMPLGQVAEVRTRLEQIDPQATERRDFWRMVKAGIIRRDGSDRVARFFAAGIVGENPQAFGLSGQPLSSIY
jgi:pSer/pThr/pTyr-binding forkhead associated (FHA) protein